jgi:hypothetical protein
MRPRTPLRARWSAALGGAVLCAASVAGITASSGIAQAATTTRGPDGIASASSNGTLCLDVQNGKIVEGANVGMWDCTGSANQQFHETNSGMLVAGGLCLQADNVDSRTHMATCVPGKTTQQWAFLDDESPHNFGTGKCLPSGTHGTYGLMMQVCDGSSTQSWIMPDSAFTSFNFYDSSAGDHALEPLTNLQLCLDATGGAQTAGTLVGVYPCGNNAANQQFVLGKDGTLRTGNSCLAAHGNGKVHLDACDPNEHDGSQTWAANGIQGLGPVQIVGGLTRQCLTAPTTTTAQIAVQPCSNRPDDTQLWFGPKDMPATDSVNPMAGLNTAQSVVNDNLCLDAYQGSLTPGTVVGVYPCGTYAANQQFVPHADGTLRAGTSCLAAHADGKLLLETCIAGLSDGSQTWSANAIDGSNTVAQLLGGATHGCITAPTSATSQISVARCSNAVDDGQAWNISAGSAVQAP